MEEIIDASPDERVYLEGLVAQLYEGDERDAMWSTWDRPDVYYMRIGEGAVIFGFVNYRSGVAYMNVFHAADALLAGAAAVRVLEMGIEILIVDRSVILPVEFRQQVLPGCHKKTIRYDGVLNVEEVTTTGLIAIHKAAQGQFPIRIRVGCAAGYPGESKEPETWMNVDVAIDVTVDGFKLKFAEPLIFAVDKEDLSNDRLMFMEWNGSRLLWGESRWNKLHYHGTCRVHALRATFEDWTVGRNVDWFAWDELMMYDVWAYHSEWIDIKNALASLVVQQRLAASRIQRSWKRCFNDIEYGVARKRLKKEFEELCRDAVFD